VLAISLFAAVVSRPWTGFTSPDSEFYATLALHGSDVADRALDPAYTWTRLGYIAPVRLLVTALDPFIGFWLWRFVLILAIVGALYAIVRITSTRQLAVIIAAFASLNTMVLAFVGTTYLTGTVIAATSVLLAFGVWGALGQPHRAWLPALLSGVTAGWLVMTNPYAFLLGLAMWVAIRISQLARDRSLRSVGRDALMGIGGAALSFGLFLLAGALIFPGRNWFETYITWNARLDYAAFIGDRDVWQRDIGLLVPLLAVAIALVALLLTRGRVARTGLVVALTSIVFTVVYYLLVPGPWLESPTYVAKLWPGALVGVALAFAALVGQRRLGLPGWLTAAAGIALVLWAGRWDTDLTAAQGLLVAGGVLALVLTAALVAPRGPNALAAVLLVAAMVGVVLGGQLLQNGRGLLGTYGQFPLRAAFVDFDAELLMRSRMTAQEWVLANTEPTDRVMTWTDAQRLTSGIAAMQLWGWYNTVTTDAVLGRRQAEDLRAARPDVIAMYAPTRDEILDFWASLPADSGASVPDCTTVPFLGIGSTEAHICLTRLRWSQLLHKVAQQARPGESRSRGIGGVGGQPVSDVLQLAHRRTQTPGRRHHASHHRLVLMARIEPHLLVRRDAIVDDQRRVDEEALPCSRDETPPAIVQPALGNLDVRIRSRPHCTGSARCDGLAQDYPHAVGRAKVVEVVGHAEGAAQCAPEEAAFLVHQSTVRRNK
jgi:hypothetical protein